MDERIQNLLTTTESLLASNIETRAAVVELVAVIKTQHEHIGLLVQAVALLLGEDLGTPLEKPDGPSEAPRTDMDGNLY
ncbi:MAG TPA: hypothetical protein VES70_27800 [Pseudomonas sp.]|nr:hypothetical protein [Pseudomonas sp.]